MSDSMQQCQTREKNILPREFHSLLIENKAKKLKRDKCYAKQISKLNKSETLCKNIWVPTF